jgi:hypothetical protein
MKRALLILLLFVALLAAVDARTKNTTTSQDKEKCIQGCQQDNRDRIKECNTYYPPESQPVKHRECLDKAKTKFDACMATCE